MRAQRWIVPTLFVAALGAYPHFVPDFWIVSVGAYAIVLGIIALSLTFLAAYGGMISLAQMAIAGAAGYALAIFSPHSASGGVAVLPWPWAVAVAMVVGTGTGLLIGVVAVRSQGIYMLMSTLAIAMILFYLAQQNTTLLHGFDGFRGVAVPSVGGKSLRDPMLFYYLCLACGALVYGLVIYLVHAPFGLVIRGARDDPRRMASLGYRVAWHQVTAYGVAGFIAAVGGVLALWYHGGISPGSVGMTSTVSVLIASVIGGLGHPRGAFIGALTYVLIQTFAVDLVGNERFNTLIGLVFLVIVMMSPDGLTGLWRRIRGDQTASGGVVVTPRQ